MTHGCVGCTHLKRSDLISEGAIFGSDQDVAGEENEENAAAINTDGNDVQIPVVQSPPQQDTLPPGQPRGYVRMAVMDGKTITHRMNARDPWSITKMAVFVTHTSICAMSAASFHVDSPSAMLVLAENQGGHGPALHISLAALGNTPGDQVVHTFKAKTIYCLQMGLIINDFEFA
ncbi:hypothetical protein B0H13DRAFT_1931716 [Mycena leptocephala]|nr:hypothetical protein B0H13DRAFT_1931716 [Mycena leptocephala]